jgi:outer membrane protein assembly factor BamB
MVLVGDYVYAGHGHGEGHPICIEWKTGKIVWGGKVRGQNPPGGGSAAVMYVDGHLIFRYENGQVALIEATPEGYKLKGSFKPAVQERESWAHPVVAGGRLYLREQNKLMCYDLKK